MDAFDQISLDSAQVKTKHSRNNGKGDAFDQIPEKEQSWVEAISRTGASAATGYASGGGYIGGVPVGLLSNLSNFLAMGDVNDPEEMERIKAIAEREGVPFDEEKYKEAAQQALASFPTPSNIARMTEEATGLPLTPKNKFQKAVETGLTAGRAQPGTAAQKAVAGVVAPAVSRGAQELGVPEPAAEALGYATSGIAGSKTPSVDIGKSKSASGLTNRQYEKLQKPTKVSEGKIQKINEKLENEFRDIASDIIEKSPIEETYINLKNDVGFKEAAKEGFQKVEQLAESIPEKFPTSEVVKELSDHISEKKTSGFLPSEYEKSHNKFIKEMIKETPKGDIKAIDLVKQFRKNNKSFSEIKEPGQSYAYNQAKRDALRDYNIAIEKTMERKFPESEFSNLFKSQNEKWSKIMDAETISGFLDDLFDGKVKFKTGRDFFDKNGMKVPFQRALGKEGFKNFDQLMKDLMNKEKAVGMLKVAKEKGFSDLAKTGMAFVVHPIAGSAKFSLGMAKEAYRYLWEAVLDKPQLSITWDKGIKAFKKGEFAKAEKEFDVLRSESSALEQSEKNRMNALKKFNEKKFTK